MGQGYRSGSRQGWGGYPLTLLESGRGRLHRVAGEGSPSQADPNCTVPPSPLPRCSPQASRRSITTSDSHTGPLTAPDRLICLLTGHLREAPSRIVHWLPVLQHSNPNIQHSTHTPKRPRPILWFCHNLSQLCDPQIKSHLHSQPEPRSPVSQLQSWKLHPALDTQVLEDLLTQCSTLPRHAQHSATVSPTQAPWSPAR